MKGFQCLDYVIADAARVGDRGVRANPDTLVDSAPQVLGELTKDLAADGRTALARVEGQRDFRSVLCSGRCGKYG